MWSRVKSLRRLVVMLASAASLLSIVPAILQSSAALAQSPAPGSEVAEVVEEIVFVYRNKVTGSFIRINNFIEAANTCYPHSQNTVG
jgi:hypothetical protein